MPPDPLDVRVAGMLAMVNTLTADPGPDGQPTPAAIEKAAAIARLLDDPQSLAEVLADES